MAIVRDQEASSSTLKYNYQVFLSFRGEDTRKTFTDHLYTALVQAGLRTFRDDDDIERGNRLELKLRKAIQHLSISIIVLSKNYVFSKWCLDEVVMILEWSRSSSHIVLPVFYDVDPFDLHSYIIRVANVVINDEEKNRNNDVSGAIGTEIIEGLVLDMQMYKDDTFNVRHGKKLQYDEFCNRILPSNQGKSFRRHYFNILSSNQSSDVYFNYDTFSRMDKLRLLKLNYAKLSGCCEYFPEGLRWLCWHGFPLKSIPFELPLGNLVSLDMSYSKLEHVWAGKKVLLSLKILNLSHCQRLVKTPNFTGLHKLERLILEGCISLVEVCNTIGNLKRLALLNLENCKSLRKFPNIGMLKSLQTLLLDGCLNIREFLMDLTSVESLKVLNANGVTINALTSTCRDPIKLWHSLFQPWLSKPILKSPRCICVSLPRSLISLSLQNCNLLDDDFPLDFSNLSMLKELDLSYNLFLNLPGCVGSLHQLSTLVLSSCKKLHSISGLPNIKTLRVDGCRSLESVTYQVALITTPSIYSVGCVKLREVQGMFKLESMDKVNREIFDNLGLRGIELIRTRLSLKFWNTFNSLEVRIEENRRQGLYEFGIFSTFVRGEDIPSWCGDRNNNMGSSSSVSFVVPSHPPGLRIPGLNVYSVYTLSNTDHIGHPNLLFTKIYNKTKQFKWIYTPVAIAIPGEENEEEEFVWLSHWKFWNHLENGDEVDISIITSEGLEVKEFGINLVWGGEEEGEEGEKEEEDMKANTCQHDNKKKEPHGDRGGGGTEEWRWSGGGVE
ncbi:hypothetical protein LguiB_006555 [Lonicera macranthoides]